MNYERSPAIKVSAFFFSTLVVILVGLTASLFSLQHSLFVKVKMKLWFSVPSAGMAEIAKR